MEQESVIPTNKTSLDRDILFAKNYVKDARNKSILQPIKGLDYFFEQAINAARKEAIDEVFENLPKFIETYIHLPTDMIRMQPNPEAIDNLKNSMK